MESPEPTSPHSEPDRSQEANLEEDQPNNSHNTDTDQVDAVVENLKREPSEEHNVPETNDTNNNLNNNKSLHENQSSLQSLMQVTGLEFNNTNNGSTRFSPQTKRRKQEPLNPVQRNFNPTTSSLFSILAGLTQQQANQQKLNQLSQAVPQQAPLTRNAKPAHGGSGGTLNLSHCPRSSNNNGNNNSNINFSNNHLTNPTSINSSLLTLLNEKISGNVASSLQSQLKKNHDPSARIQTSNARATVQSNSPFYQQTNLSNNIDNNGYNSGALLNNLGFNNGDARQLNIDNSLSSLNPFIESIAKRTGSNIGPAGIVEAKKIIEKFTTWLLNSSQTIADHYIAPYATDLPQQKPEISASDVILAYKMMQKTQPQ